MRPCRACRGVRVVTWVGLVPGDRIVQRVRGVAHSYELLSVREYDSPTRGRAEILEWRGECAACFRPFEVRSGRIVRALQRGCPEHRPWTRFIPKEG